MNCRAHSHFLVTGASSGIGEATALRLASAGHHVFAGIRKPSDGAALQHSSSEASGAPGEITPLALDVTDGGQIRAAAEAVAAHVGSRGLDGLVDNAGIGVFGPLELMPLDAFRRQLEVNVVGQLAVTQGFLGLLRAARGSVVLMGSIGDRIVMPFLGPLAASKFALSAMAQALRQELAPWGVRVVLIEPASIASEAPGKLERDAERFLNDSTAEGRSLYEGAFRQLVRRFAARAQAGSPPQVVAETVSQALMARRPRSRYLVGHGSRRLALVAAIPAPLADAVRRRMFHLPAPGSAVAQALGVSEEGTRA